MMRRCQSFSRDDSGAMMVLTALLLVVLLGFVALAVDIGHLIVVKNELQNAADAGAMAGANSFAPFITANPPLPDWNSGYLAADSTTKANRTDNTLITDCRVEIGYFNLITRELQSTGIKPGPADVPAARVTVSRVEGQNTGPVLTWFARVLGIDIMNVSATAMAMISCPSAAPPGSLFPVAMNVDFVRRYYDQNMANPDAPETFKIGSDYHYDDVEAGQWTSFFDVHNDTTTIRDLLYQGNPDPIRIGDLIRVLADIYIEPGTKTALYNDVKNFIGKNVWVPVVPVDFETHEWNRVLCYLPIHIVDAKGGNKKYIEAHFVKRAIFPSNDVGGPCYGGFSPPRMLD